MRKKKTNKFRFNLWGILLIFLLVIFVTFLIFSSYIYQDLKKVELNMVNLYQQLRTTNSNFERFSISDESRAQQQLKFSEVTKKWNMYENNEYSFQLKTPASWGNLEIYSIQNEAENPEVKGTRLFARFPQTKSSPIVNLIITNNGFEIPNDNLIYSNLDVSEALIVSDFGECNNQLFEKLKELGLGEIRNCFVKENILGQRYILYRAVSYDEENTVVTDQLLAVYPRGEYFLTVTLPNEISEEVEYFIQSLVFLQQ